MATAQDLLKLANRHLGEQYALGAFAPKDNPNWKGPGTAPSSSRG